MNTVVIVVASTVVYNSCCYVDINTLELYDTGVSESRVPWQRNTAQALCVMTKEFRMANHNICICLQVKCPAYDTFEYYTYSCRQQFWVQCVFSCLLSRRTLWRRGIRKSGTPNGQHPSKCFVKASLVSSANHLFVFTVLFHFVLIPPDF